MLHCENPARRHRNRVRESDLLRNEDSSPTIHVTDSCTAAGLERNRQTMGENQRLDKTGVMALSSPSASGT